jgi:hypothetical protein
MAREVRRHGRVTDGTHEGAGRREPTSEEDVAEVRLKAEIVAEALTKKW